MEVVPLLKYGGEDCHGEEVGRKMKLNKTAVQWEREGWWKQKNYGNNNSFKMTRRTVAQVEENGRK